MRGLAVALQGRVWAPAAVAAAAGALCPLTPGWPLALVAGLWVVLAAALCRRGRTLSGPVAAWVAVALISAGSSGHRPPRFPPPLHPGKRGEQPPVQVLRVASAPLPTAEGWGFEARWLATCAPGGASRPSCDRRWGRLRVRVDGARGWEGPGRGEPAVGDVLRAVAHVRPPPGYANPGGGEVARRWRERGLYGRLRLRAPEVIALQPPGPSWRAPLVHRLARLGGRARTALSAGLLAVLPERAGGVVRALALGDRGGVDPALRAFLRDSGTAHILAVSGAHVGLVLLGLGAALRLLLGLALPGLLRRYGLWRLVAPPCIAAAWAYALLTGGAPSTLRAATMASLALLARVGSADADLAEIVGLAALVLLAVDPGAAGDPGLRLSFLGVVGAATGGGLLRLGRRGWRGRLARALGVSVGAWSMTAPVSAPLFGSLPLLAPLCNLVVVPWVGVCLLPLSLSITALVAVRAACSAPFVAAVIGWLRPVLTAAIAPLHGLAGLTAGRLPGLAPGPRGGLILGLGLAAAFLILRFAPGRARLLGALALAAALVAVPLDRRVSLPPRGSFLASFLDVGHGDCVLLRFSNGLAALVDGGGDVSGVGGVGERAVLPALRALGVRRLDLLIITHAHPDHFGGMLEVARALPVGELWHRPRRGGGPRYASLLALLRASGATLRDVDASPPASPLAPAQDGVWLRLIRPRDPAGGPPLGANDASLVVEVAAGPHRLLLTGDIEARSEARLAAAGQLRPVVVLKVPHHGSRTSSTAPLLRTTRPTLAVVSARTWGRMPFPHPHVRARYAAWGLALWETERGAVRLHMGPRGWCARQASREVCGRVASPRLRRPRTHSHAPHDSQARADVRLPASRPGGR